MERIFWLDGWKGEEAKGGLYFRCNLKTHIKKVIDTGRKPVGITVDDDSFNIQILYEEEPDV